MRYLIAYILFIVFALVFGFLTKSEAAEEPQISIYQGSDIKTSVIIIVWPDGVKESLKFKNNTEGYATWFQERYDAYEKRNK